MEKVDMNYLLVIFGVIAIIIEVILGAPTGFDLLIMGVILMIGGGVGMLTGSLMVALGVIILLSFVYIFLGRNMVKEKLHAKGTKSNVDRFFGKKAVVTKKITPQSPGQVKIEGEIWRAAATREIGIGKEVVVQSVEGVTFQVDLA